MTQVLNYARMQQAREELVALVGDAMVEACVGEDVAALTDMLDDAMGALEGRSSCVEAAGFMRAAWNCIPWRVANSRGCSGLAWMCGAAANICDSALLAAGPADAWVLAARALHRRCSVPTWVGVVAAMKESATLGDVDEVLQVCAEL